MDESPEPTMILRTVNDFRNFVSSGTKARESMYKTGSSRLRLNFSDIKSDSSMDESKLSAGQQSARKRPLDALTGLDVAKRFREKDTELAEAKSTIMVLEGRLHNIDTCNKRARLGTETEIDNLKRKLLRDKELIDDLQHKIKQLQASQREAQEEARKAKIQCNMSSYESETKVVNMQREYIEQNNRLTEEVSLLRQRVQDLETEDEEKTLEMESTRSLVDVLTQQLNTAESKIKELSTSQLQLETLQLQLEQAKAKIKDLEMQRSEFSDMEKKSEIFQSTVSKLYDLEKENTRLKEENKFFKDTAINTTLLEEKLVNAKQQIMLLESRCEDVAHFQAKADLFKNKLKTLEDIIMEELNLTQKPTLQELKSHISKLKREDIQLTTGIEQLSASQRCMEHSREQAEQENRNLRSKLDKQQNVIHQNVQIIKRLQRKVLLLTQERDSLKHIITTYEAELTINYSTVSQERIEKLESQLQSYREELKLMEEELEETYKSVVEGSETPKKRDRGERVLGMEKKMTELEEEVKKLKEENESLIQAKEVLEGRIENLTLKGDYDPTTTKVLHFKNNPLSAAIESRETQLETLQKENEALRERVRLLEEGEQHDLTQKVGMKVATEGHSSKEVANLQEQIASIETRNKRLMELFKKKSLEMREAIYLLTGYRVDSTGDNHYKLTNIYAESSDDFFMFQLSADGQVHLLETEYSSTLEELMDTYLQRKHSFPAFLSRVTLDLFRKHSRESPLSGIEEEMDDEDEDEMEDMRREAEQRQQLPMSQGDEMPEDEEEMEEEEEEELEEEEEEEENEEGEEAEEDDGDDLICLD
ncbi:mitotic spindle assembly checkpoint protein MAD1-like [Palaemon carinicauda]|uniref:mitotic spindle assembly checkpoint protein MAD1-like n=1 Tax=Palaemon carinicauda TaxID=392227 RepID=UPI0035B6691A